MPYPNEHAARVRDPGDFIQDSFRRKEVAPGVSLIMGKLKADGRDGPMVIQSVRFDKDKFTPEEARAWCKEHDIEVQSFEAASDEKFIPSIRAVTELKTTDKTVNLGFYGFVWGGKDLTGEYFEPDTDFWFDRLVAKPLIFYDHGLNEKLKRYELGRVSEMKQDEIGLWVEAEIRKSQEYMEMIRPLVLAGRLGASSGAVGHLCERTRSGKIISWPTVEFSLTPMPAEPRTLGVAELRSLLASAPEVKAILPEAAGDAAGGATEDAKPVLDISIKKAQTGGNQMSDQSTQIMLPPELTSMLKALNDKLDAIANAPVTTPAGLVIGAEGDDRAEHKSFGDFLIAVQRNDKKRLSSVYKAALAEGTGEYGGYTVPEQFVSELLEAAAEEQVIEPGAFILPMSSQTVKIPSLDQVTAPAAGQSAFYGGVVMSWTPEAGALSETEPKFKQVELTAHKLGGYSLASNELLADNAVGLEALLVRLYGKAIGWYRDYAHIRGTGVGQPLGFFNSGALKTVPRTTAGTFVLADAAAMLSVLPAASMKRAVWIMHQTVLPKLVQLADAAGNVLWLPNMREQIPMTLFGLPVYFSEKVPALGTQGDVNLVDRSYYVVGNRGQIEIASSVHYKFINDQTTWRVIDRSDGRPWLSAPITLADASTTVSPFVQLTNAA